MSPGGLKGEFALASVSMESCEGEVALEVEGESSRDSELPLTFIHSMTVVPVAVLEPERDLEETDTKTSRDKVWLLILLRSFYAQCSILSVLYVHFVQISAHFPKAYGSMYITAICYLFF